MPDHLKILISSYDGYRNRSNLSKAIYPISIISYLNDVKPSMNSPEPDIDYWIRTVCKLSASLHFVFINFQVRSKLEPLLNLKNTVEIDNYYINQTIRQLEMIAKLIQNKNENYIALSESTINSAIGMLLSTGYLTMSASQLHGGSVSVKVPNGELCSFFKREFRRHYHNNCKCDKVLLKTSKDFEEYLNGTQGDETDKI